MAIAGPCQECEPFDPEHDAGCGGWNDSKTYMETLEPKEQEAT